MSVLWWLGATAKASTKLGDARPVDLHLESSVLSYQPQCKLTMCRFGTVATLLELVPFASIFFTFTNTGKRCFSTILCHLLNHNSVGAALWAADIEANNTNMTEMEVPQSREDAKKEL